MSNHYKVIACNVMWREMSYHAALSPNSFRLEFLDGGLHENPDQLRIELQRAIDETEEGYDAILLGYGLCSNGTAGIIARHTPLVIPRGHDCITCFLGSKERYQAYFADHPGTYWYTPGWIENHPAPGQERYETTYQSYLERFGEDNAQYLMDLEQDWFNKYSTAAFIDLGIGDTARYADYTRQCAEWLKWNYERLDGDPTLYTRLLSGDWGSDAFLVVEPGQMIAATNGPDIVAAVPSQQ